MEVHAVSGQSHSLPVFYAFNTTGTPSNSLSLSPVMIGAVVLVSLGWASSIAITRSISPLAATGIVKNLLSKASNEANIDIIDAEIIDSTSEK
mgnify:FL=1